MVNKYLEKFLCIFIFLGILTCFCFVFAGCEIFDDNTKQKSYSTEKNKVEEDTDTAIDSEETKSSDNNSSGTFVLPKFEEEDDEYIGEKIYLDTSWLKRIRKVDASINEQNIIGVKFTDRRPQDFSFTVSVGVLDEYYLTYHKRAYGEYGITAFVIKNSENKYKITFYCPTTIYLLSASEMFFCFENLEYADFDNINTEKIYTMYRMFSNCKSLKWVNLSKFDTKNVRNMISVFDICKSLESIDVSNFDTSRVENMERMFAFCEKLKTIDCSNFDTSNVTSMEYMFGSCNSLESLNISNFDTSNVINMRNLFSYDNDLKKLDVSHFDTSNVVNMSYMFNGCSLLENIDVSHFDTTKVIDMSFMFSYCNNLKQIDLSNFKTPSLKKVRSMFSGSNQLKEIDLSSFDFSSIEDALHLLSYCDSLEKINSPKNIRIEIDLPFDPRWHIEGEKEYGLKILIITEESFVYTKNK